MTKIVSTTEVQPRTCACKDEDAKRCYEIRYPAPMDDLQRADHFAMFGDEECQCVCHNDYEYDFHDDIY